MERAIDKVWILTLYGEQAEEFEDVDAALAYLDDQPDEKSGHLVRIELQVHFTDGSRVDGTFGTKTEAKEFLKNRKQGLL